MNENVRKYYFPVIKFIYIMAVFIYYVVAKNQGMAIISRNLFFMAGLLMAAVLFEIQDKKRHIFLGLEILFLVAIFFCNQGSLFLPMVILDILFYFNLPFALGIMIYAGLLFTGEKFIPYFTLSSFLLILYFQNYVIIRHYKKQMEIYEQKEVSLKDSIDTKDNLFRKELEQNSLYFENRILEEKAGLSQALHDKLGHSINGSVYQLEASKVLLKEHPEQGLAIVQAVIDNLRSSMDEIRLILRREKPDKKSMALLQLQNLCKECRAKYKMETQLLMEGDTAQISETMWEIILDNTFEAVSNALKYSKCSLITIRIICLNKLVRCSIRDNGIGCSQLKEGMGIQGMKNRIRQVNGTLDINCDNGFIINMIIPFEITGNL